MGKSAMESTEGGVLMSKEEFTLLNETPEMSEWLIDIGVYKMHQDLLFEALDVGGGRISYAEFLAALESMSGQTHMATDLIVQLYQTRSWRQDLMSLRGHSTDGRSDWNTHTEEVPKVHSFLV